MRGDDPRHDSMFSYVTREARVRAHHPLRPIRRMTDAALARLSARFDRLYATTGARRLRQKNFCGRCCSSCCIASGASGS
jgi:hypothetical protein